jgi:DNA primase small subunit
VFHVGFDCFRGEIDKNNMPELMRQYYGRFFPYGRFIEWLSYGDRDKLAQREFSFTIRVPFQKDEEVYLRYLSYSSKNEFKNDLIKKNPEKIDIGAVFSARPKTKNALRPGAFKPVERELVFDIDMTDYDAVRTCCSGADICNLCWKYMTVAVKILHRALTEDFGFKNLLWVYSGRRGVHCWVCDEKARKLSEEARKAVVNYLEVIKGGEKKEKKVYFPPGSLHPSIKKSLKVLEKYFSEIFLEDQDILSYPDKEKMFLNIMQDEKMRNELETEFDGLNDSKDKWHTFVKYLANNPDKKTQQLRNEIVFQYLYPRLDAQVSMHLNHLLKSPFCVHPKTGKVCVPFRAENADQFDPLNVPTVYGLCQEINDYNSKHAGDDQAKKISGNF